MKGYYISGFSVPRMIQVKAMHGVSGQEEVMELFVVTGGAECAMLLRLQAPAGGTSGVQSEVPSRDCRRALSMITDIAVTAQWRKPRH